MKPSDITSPQLSRKAKRQCKTFTKATPNKHKALTCQHIQSESEQMKQTRRRALTNSVVLLEGSPLSIKQNSLSFIPSNDCLQPTKFEQNSIDNVEAKVEEL